MAISTGLTKSNSQDQKDVVAFWNIPLMDGVHKVEFEHGTTTGRRVLRVDGKEILRRDWMFKLVGEERFTMGKQQAKCELRVDPGSYFTFLYSLLVDGKPLEKFTEKQVATNRSWSVVIGEEKYRIVLGKQSLNVWVNGQDIETENFFVENGTEMHFDLGQSKVVIKADSANKQDGVIHVLELNGQVVQEDKFLYS